jgi:GGDEF domain-containing protein
MGRGRVRDPCPEHVTSVCARPGRAHSRPRAWEGTRWRVTASVGVAAAEPDVDGTLVDSAMLMHLADAAMQAKRSGRNMVAAATGQ